ncbi:MAG: TIM barrel protein [Rhodothermales bacterium]|nr:TIM barrel protein [Rhodothermales bacterium]
MELSLIRQLWGIDKPWDDVFSRIAKAGYQGVEIALPFLSPTSEYKSLLEKHNLQIVPMIFTAGTSVREHVSSFREQLTSAIQFDPILVTCHDGKDAFTADDSRMYYREVLAIEKDLGFPVAHETHRGRILYNPWTTAHMLDSFADLQLCCDFSHWVCVCERLIADQEDIIQACADRAIHVHGRVGYAEGPQVPDPRSEMYRGELEAHELWWDMIWGSQSNRGLKVSTFTPEFGPPPYMQTNPNTGEPASDLWEISNWIADRQRERFSRRSH